LFIYVNMTSDKNYHLHTHSSLSSIQIHILHNLTTWYFTMFHHNIYIQQCGWCLFGDHQPHNNIFKKTTSPLSNFYPWSPTTSWEIIFHWCMLTPLLYTKNYKVSIWRPFSWWMFLNPHNKIVIKTTIQNYNQS
jgi:hypothetical protein